MSELRQRLAEVLREHTRHGYRNCRCATAIEQDGPGRHEQHLADVLLSTAGIAIVELPEQTGDAWPCGHAFGPDGPVFVWNYNSDPGTGMSSLARLSHPRAVAAALLAADAAAEEAAQ